MHTHVDSVRTHDGTCSLVVGLPIQSVSISMSHPPVVAHTCHTQAAHT